MLDLYLVGPNYKRNMYHVLCFIYIDYHEVDIFLYDIIY